MLPLWAVFRFFSETFSIPRKMDLNPDLECGDLHFGFARVRCQECGHEYLLA